MNLPSADDAVLFGSLAVFAFGLAVVVGSLTNSLGLAFGVALMSFGLPAAVLAFLAAGEPK